MKETNQDPNDRNQEQVIQRARMIEGYFLKGLNKGIMAFNDDINTINCLSIKSGSSKIEVRYGDGCANNSNIEANPTIDVVPTEIDKNELGGKPLSIINGGTGKDSFLRSSVLLGNSEGVIQELAKGEKGQVLICTEDDFRFAKIEGRGLEIATESTKISLKTKAITIKTANDIEIDPPKSEIHLGDTISLETKPISLKTKNGLFITKGESEVQEKEVKLGDEITLVAKPIILHMQGGLYIDEGGKKVQNKAVDLASKVTLAADKINIVTQGGLTGGGEVTLGGVITLSSKESLKWKLVTDDTEMEANTGYIIATTNNLMVNFDLPNKPSIGDTIKIVANGSIKNNNRALWKIKLQKAEKIHFSGLTIEAHDKEGKLVLGSLAGRHSSECITMVCIKSNSKTDSNNVEWIVTDSIGNLIINDK